MHTHTHDLIYIHIYIGAAEQQGGDGGSARSARARGRLVARTGLLIYSCMSLDASIQPFIKSLEP